MYYGNEFYVFTYQDYNDVRLGNTTESRQVRRAPTTGCHVTGDFSMLRIYADKKQPRSVQRGQSLKPKRRRTSAWPGWTKPISP